MYILIDADSVIFATAVTTNNIEQAKEGFDWRWNGIVWNLKQRYEIDGLFVFSGSKGNFRKLITSDYKANRKQEVPAHLGDLHSYVKEEYNSIYKYGVETDDVIASYWKRAVDNVGEDNVVIVALDKDYKQFPCIFYNYNKNEAEKISREQALVNFYSQMVEGDSADNVNYCKGYGKAWCKKNLTTEMSEYSLIRAVFSVFKTLYKGKAREKYIQCYNLLKLRTDV